MTRRQPSTGWSGQRGRIQGLVRPEVDGAPLKQRLGQVRHDTILGWPFRSYGSKLGLRDRTPTGPTDPIITSQGSYRPRERVTLCPR